MNVGVREVSSRMNFRPSPWKANFICPFQEGSGIIRRSSSALCAFCEIYQGRCIIRILERSFAGGSSPAQNRNRCGNTKSSFTVSPAYQGYSCICQIERFTDSRHKTYDVKCRLQGIDHPESTTCGPTVPAPKAYTIARAVSSSISTAASSATLRRRAGSSICHGVGRLSAMGSGFTALGCGNYYDEWPSAIWVVLDIKHVRVYCHRFGTFRWLRSFVASLVVALISGLASVRCGLRLRLSVRFVLSIFCLHPPAVQQVHGVSATVGICVPVLLARVGAKPHRRHRIIHPCPEVIRVNPPDAVYLPFLIVFLAGKSSSSSSFSSPSIPFISSSSFLISSSISPVFFISFSPTCDSCARVRSFSVTAMA